MEEYTSKFTGNEIDTRLEKVGTLENYDDSDIRTQLSDLTAAVSSKASSGELNEHISDTDFHVTSADKSQISSIDSIKKSVEEISMEVGSKASQSALAGHINARDMHTTAVEKGNWNNAAERSSLALSTLGYERKNLLKNTAISKTQNGITFTVNEDGSLAVSGTATATAASTLSYGFLFKSGARYIISGCPTGGADSTYRIDVGDTTDGYSIFDYGNGVEFTPTEDKNYSVRVRIAPNAVMNNVVFYPMIRYADIPDDSYEPYKPSVEERLAALEGGA